MLPEQIASWATVLLADLHNYDVQKLLIQTLWGDEEVEQRNLNRHLRWVVRVGQLACHVEPEVWVVWDHIIAYLDDFTATLSYHTLGTTHHFACPRTR